MASRVARLNAVTHGLTAETLILPGEDPREFQRLLDDWTAQLEPANPFEHDLVRQVATLSWRLDRADRVQDALIADSLGTDTAEQRRAEVADLGCRLLPPPRVPNFVRRFGVWADLDRLAHRGPDDPDDPPRLLLRLEATADGCRWLLDRWAELRQVVDAGTPWPDEPMVQAIRLLGKRPFDAVDDFQVLTIFVATYVMDRSRPDPFAELWKTTTDREAIYYRERLLGRRLRERSPIDGAVREVLLGIVDAAVAGLEEEERQNRRRERELAALRPRFCCSTPALRGNGCAASRGRRRGRSCGSPSGSASALSGRDAERGPSQTAATRTDGDPSVGDSAGGRPAATAGGSVREAGWEGRIPPLVILDDPSRRQPREYIGGRSEGRRKEIKNVLKYKGRRCSPERAEKIAIRAIEWLLQIGLVLLLAASLGTIAAAPSSDRPEDSPRLAHPDHLDDATDHPLQGHPGPNIAVLSP